MRIRKQDSNGDFSFGRGIDNYWVNQVEGVSQLIKTRLLLWQGEWFLDTTDGTPWLNGILGENTSSTYNVLIKARIFDTEGVTQIEQFNSTIDNATRRAKVDAIVYTAYSTQPTIVTL